VREEQSKRWFGTFIEGSAMKHRHCNHINLRIDTNIIWLILIKDSRYNTDIVLLIFYALFLEHKPNFTRVERSGELIQMHTSLRNVGVGNIRQRLRSFSRCDRFAFV